VFRVINELYAEKSGRTFWFSKEPGLFRHIYEVRTHMQNAKFVYMTRDGRDVAASMLTGGVHEFHVYNAAQRWALDQRYCLCAFSDPMIRNQTFMLKYEDLIENTESTMRRLMSFVGLEFETSQMEYYRNESVVKHAGKSEFWKNIAKPIDSSNKGKYRNSLGTKNTEIFESVAWTEMSLLGYPLESLHRKKITAAHRVIFRLVGFLRKACKRMDMKVESSRIRARTEIFRSIRNRKFAC
jgi:hypothetical protein